MAEPDTVFITADEVDEPPPPPEAFDVAKEHTIPGIEDVDPQSRAAQQALQHNGTVPVASRPSRPPLKRDKSTPQPAGTWTDFERSTADALAGRDHMNDVVRRTELYQNNSDNAAVGNATDSLSLGQLKKLVQESPKIEPTPYAFEYEDTPCFEEDVEDFFEYSWQERNTLLSSRQTFDKYWEAFQLDDNRSNQALSWIATDESKRRHFLERLVPRISRGNEEERMEGLECLLYLALGSWYDTAGMPDPEEECGIGRTYLQGHVFDESEYELSGLQIRYIRKNIESIVNAVPFSLIFDLFRAAYTPGSHTDEEEKIDNAPDIYQQRQRMITEVLVYLTIEVSSTEGASTPLGIKLQESVAPIHLPLMIFLTDVLVSTRWDDAENTPPTKILQLYWKTILLVFGGLHDIERVKDALARNNETSTNQAKEDWIKSRITASPLDYHVFRQEIISKYPAYNPPPALFPFEPDNNSFLPPLQDVIPKTGANSQPATSVGPANINGAGTSILNQPVHIATPAPSPPPSPAGPGGKGLKKQNYQTNQMFPFLYPPLDPSSNDLGGKGTTELQDIFAGRKWNGSDIPASILEAADLFAQRMRATRAMKQLWEERARFMKFEQGYGSLDSVNGSEVPVNGDKKYAAKSEADDLDILEEDLRLRMDAVESYYNAVLPRLQSVVIALLKTLIQTITTLITQAEGLEVLEAKGVANDPNVQYSGADHDMGSSKRSSGDGEDASLHELMNMRNQEIMGKAVSGIILLLLKWFKISHILKFEYLSQLLLDSNYIQFILKLFTHQELDRAVNYKCERKDLNFFSFCRANSKHAHRTSTTTQSTEEDDPDDAEPPPIQLSRQEPSKAPVPTAGESGNLGSSAPTSAPTQPPPNPPPPEVDELGYPVSAIPVEPITHYSWRTFFTSINYLRIVQKMIKSKPHRQLLMVQGKYSNTLKKHLKVPQPDVRLYTLKIIKGQVPYCHRKWRQSNMRIITAIYLHVKPGLRDEWLSGLDVEQEVGEALPAEQALRALTYWYNLRRYPAQMGVAESASVAASASALPPGIAGKFSEDFNLDLDPDFTGLDSVVAREQDLDVLEENIRNLRPDSRGETSNGLLHSSNASSSAVAVPSSSSLPASKQPTPQPQDSQQESNSNQGTPHIPPLMLREQDFFLRELEKMDFGLSLPSPSVSRSSSRHSSRPVSSAGVPGYHVDPMTASSAPATPAQPMENGYVAQAEPQEHPRQTQHTRAQEQHDAAGSASAVPASAVADPPHAPIDPTAPAVATIIADPPVPGLDPDLDMVESVEAPLAADVQEGEDIVMAEENLQQEQRLSPPLTEEPASTLDLP